jgi:hypothetical protein
MRNRGCITSHFNIKPNKQIKGPFGKQNRFRFSCESVGAVPNGKKNKTFHHQIVMDRFKEYNNGREMEGNVFHTESPIWPLNLPLDLHLLTLKLPPCTEGFFLSTHLSHPLLSMHSPEPSPSFHPLT